MKKKYFVLALFFILLCLIGYCLLNSKFGVFAVKNPYEMRINGKIISFYDKEEDIDSDLVKSIYDFSMRFQKNQSGVYVNKDGEIRTLFSKDNSINTYKNIHVGNKVSKVKNSFKYGHKRFGGSDSNYEYAVTFDDKYNEIDAENQGYDNVYIILRYIIEDNKVSYIMIEDTNPLPGKLKKAE